jgi:DNA-binding response OmpR family regulator
MTLHRPVSPTARRSGSAEEWPPLALVEDDADQREEIADFLRLSGMTVLEAGSAEELLSQLDAVAGTDLPRLFVLDIGLPGLTGIELVKEIRLRCGLAVGVVMVTARGFRNDKLDARSAGADDYLVKPIDFDELLLVLRNLWQRLAQTSVAPVPSRAVSHWQLDVAHWQLTLPSGVVVSLSENETRLLHILVNAAGSPVDRRNIVVELGHDLAYYDMRRLDVMVSRLRQKLQQAGGELPLKTVHSVGYALSGDFVLI